MYGKLGQLSGLDFGLLYVWEAGAAQWARLWPIVCMGSWGSSVG